MKGVTDQIVDKTNNDNVNLVDNKKLKNMLTQKTYNSNLIESTLSDKIKTKSNDETKNDFFIEKDANDKIIINNKDF